MRSWVGRKEGKGKDKDDVGRNQMFAIRLESPERSEDAGEAAGEAANASKAASEAAGKDDDILAALVQGR